MSLSTRDIVNNLADPKGFAKRKNNTDIIQYYKYPYYNKWFIIINSKLMIEVERKVVANKPQEIGLSIKTIYGKNEIDKVVKQGTISNKVSFIKAFNNVLDDLKFLIFYDAG